MFEDKNKNITIIAEEICILTIKVKLLNLIKNQL